MAEEKQGLLERFSERYPVRSASVVALCFALLCLIGAYIALDETKIVSGKFPNLSKIFPNKVNEWGDFLAGIFAPAALFFLALSVRIQSRELRAAVDAQEAMKSEMKFQVAQMRFSGMAPTFRSDLEKMEKNLPDFGLEFIESFCKKHENHTDEDTVIGKIHREFCSLIFFYFEPIRLDSNLNHDFIVVSRDEIRKIFYEIYEVKNSIIGIIENQEFYNYIRSYEFLLEIYKEVDPSGSAAKAFGYSEISILYKKLIFIKNVYHVLKSRYNIYDMECDLYKNISNAYNKIGYDPPVIDFIDEILNEKLIFED